MDRSFKLTLTAIATITVAGLLLVAWNQKGVQDSAARFYSYVLRPVRGREIDTKMHLHEINRALEDYADNSRDKQYPLEIEDLIAKGYLAQWPPNPFTHKPMQPLTLATHSYGDFSYLPRLIVDIDGKSTVPMYMLVAYGPSGHPRNEKTSGNQDWKNSDRIILMLDSGITHCGGGWP